MHAAPTYLRLAVPLGLVLLAAACGGGDGPSEPPLTRQPGIRAAFGAGVSDTIDAQPLQALVVEVRGPDGKLAHGAVVRFEAQPPADPARRTEAAVYVCALTQPTCGPSGFGAPTSAFASDTTDAEGRAKATVRLGRVAGRAVVRVTVPEFGMADSATYTVTPGAAVRVRASAADTALDIGATATLRGRVVDRYENTRTETPMLSASAGNTITIDAASGVVTAREMGTAWVHARHATFVDSTSVRVVPAGRLVVWSSNSRVVRLVNLNGSESRTLVSNVSSDLGAFPRFDATRQRVTLHSGTDAFGGTPSNVIVIDTTGAPRRDIGAAAGFATVISTRQIADGAVLVAGRRTGDPSSAYSVWRVAADNTVSLVAPLPTLASIYGGVDISPDGTRAAYLASTPSFLSELRVVTLASGATVVLEPSARSPRWSPTGDRVAYLVPNQSASGLDGTATVIGADGTGRRTLGNHFFSPGLAWSPDGAYLIGRNSAFAVGGPTLRILRLSDGADILLRFRTSTPGGFEDYYQPDWR